MGTWPDRRRQWLVVEPLPGYAPELNPVEALWAHLKEMELVNRAGETLEDVIATAEHRVQRIRRRTTGLLIPSSLRPEPMGSSDRVAGRGEALLFRPREADLAHVAPAPARASGDRAPGSGAT
jgi:hypothetical protein